MAMLCPEHEDGDRLISNSVGFCSDCVRNGALEKARQTHRKLRQRDKLVTSIPAEGKIVCSECGNHCKLNEGEVGFCNTRIASEEKIVDRYSDKAVVSWYFDPLPTNCVADWVCPITTNKEIGSGKERLKNFAVFYGSCNSDCLFCQNGSYRIMMAKGRPLMKAEELSECADDHTACVCYFGGDPACNPEHSVNTSRLLNENRSVTVCYETNGNISRKWLGKITETIEDTGGTFKFDLKAYTPEIYEALTGSSNVSTLRNFESIGISKRNREGEFLVASILLVPGYIDLKEVEKLCSFIAGIDSTIPTALLGFSPHHAMSDLPRTSIAHAQAALSTAKDEGLENVRIGNEGLLSHRDYKYD